MANTEQSIVDRVLDALDAEEATPMSTGSSPLHGTGEVGSIHSNSATRPFNTGMNAGSETRPMDAGFLEIADNPDYARHVAEAEAAHVAADLSLRRFRNNPVAPSGNVPGLVPTKGQHDD